MQTQSIYLWGRRVPLVMVLPLVLGICCGLLVCGTAVAISRNVATSTAQPVREILPPATATLATATALPGLPTISTPSATWTSTAVTPLRSPIPPTSTVRSTSTRPATAVSTSRPTIKPTVAAPLGSCPQGCTTQLPGCPIKGNISSSGEKIYHVPGGASYSSTVIDPSKGERWFCTDAEAVANGWRKALR